MKSTTLSPHCEHEWVRFGETKPYPGRRSHIYVRNVSQCRICGKRSVSGWARAIKSKRPA